MAAGSIQMGGAPRSAGGGSGRGKMPSPKQPGGASTGVFHGKHNVAHPVQGGSNAQSINRERG